jgi:hypothetical protein
MTPSLDLCYDNAYREPHLYACLFAWHPGLKHILFFIINSLLKPIIFSQNVSPPPLSMMKISSYMYISIHLLLKKSEPGLHPQAFISEMFIYHHIGIDLAYNNVWSVCVGQTSPTPTATCQSLEDVIADTIFLVVSPDPQLLHVTLKWNPHK